LQLERPEHDEALIPSAAAPLYGCNSTQSDAATFGGRRFVAWRTPDRFGGGLTIARGLGDAVRVWGFGLAPGVASFVVGSVNGGQ
jgi:hypothetical protein